jgi:maleylacetoacetate isomerase
MSAAARSRLYSYWRSSASYRVRIALALKGLPYDYLAVDLAKGGGEQNQPAYRAVNPQGRVPALETDGRILTQSLAILEYLEETHPQPPLLPADAFGRARVRSLAGIVACDIQPLQNLVVTQYLRDRLGVDDATVKAWLQEWIGRGLAALEARLAHEPGTGRFCHGDHPGMADACLVPQVYAAQRFGVDLARFPTVARIDATCRALAAFRHAAPEAQPDAPR